MDDRLTNLIADLFTWFGRIGRIRFFLINVSLVIIMSLPMMILGIQPDPDNIYAVIMPIGSWCWLMQFVKRGHDFGAPAWLSLIIFFASFFLVPALFWAVMPGDEGYNKYGPKRGVPFIF